MSIPSKGKAASGIRPRGSRTPLLFVLAAVVAGGLFAPPLLFSAPIAYPGTGTTTALYFFWHSQSDPDPAAFDHTDFYELESTPIFGSEAWTPATPSPLPFANVCLGWLNGRGVLVQACWTLMVDRSARYRIRSCTLAFCRDWVEQAADRWLRCCRSDSTCYAGLAAVPENCS